MPNWTPGPIPIPRQRVYGGNIDRTEITPETHKNEFPNYQQDTNPNYKPSLDPWQKVLKQKVMRSDIKGLFILISPSGGKTRPIMEGLIYKLLIKNTKFKILWSAPLKQLAYQLCNDIAKDLFGELLKTETGKIFLDRIIPNIHISDPRVNLTKKRYDEILKDIKLHYIGVKTGEGKLDGFSEVNDNTLVDITTFEIAGQNIKKYKYNAVIIDEMQEAFTLGTAKSIKHITAYNNLFKYQQDKYMYLLSGTTHKNIAKNFIDWVNKKYNSNIESFERDYTETKNRSIVNVIPTSQLANYRKLDEFILNILTKNMGHFHLMILFSKKQIKNFCETLIKRIPPYIKIPDMELNFANADNRLICACLKRGFGYIVGGQPSSVRELDKILMLSAMEKVEVARLFKNKTIKFLFSTDAVGIGVNMKVRSLYIPSVKRFDGTGLTDTSPSTLVQLLHRAGRGSVPVATIYTTPADLDIVRCHMEKDPMVVCINDFDVSLYSKGMSMDEQFKIKLMSANPCRKILSNR
jgi:hypothetical protein